MSSHALRPGPVLGSRPERLVPTPSALDRAALRLRGAVAGVARRESSLRRVVRAVEARRVGLRSLGDGGLRDAVWSLRGRLHREGLEGEAAFDAFAAVCEAARRALGMDPYDVQLMGGWVLLRGMLAEMETGEGKTLTATLPACTAALAGIPVHVVTVNDYLVERDAEQMGPLYRALGLRVGTVLERDPEPRARRAAYGCDVTYVSNKQVAFDYLRDRLRRPRGGRAHDAARSLLGSEGDAPVMRGLCYAIVDEVDSILVDEARTPLIVSRTDPAGPLEEECRRALALAGGLLEGRDYELDAREREVRLTPAGCERVGEAAAAFDGAWRVVRRREEQVLQALSALHLFRRDVEYVVRDGGVAIVDPHTGRPMPDRSWEGGLHQMIEAKEGCAVSGRRETLARISYQQFYRRYRRLAGMTGTAREVAGELAAVYRLATVRIPTRRPLRRRGWPERFHESAAARSAWVVERVAALHRTGRPVLVGTRSVAASEELAARLREAGLPHEVLNASQDRREAEIVAGAGAAGRVTVATNMAGRGTDIRLGPGVAELGGLHVLAIERGEARRIDRQLFGRCGRQGDPGSYERVTCLEDEIVLARIPGALQAAVRRLARRSPRLGQALGRALCALGQRGFERRNARLRRELLRLEESLARSLAFAGPPD